MQITIKKFLVCLFTLAFIYSEAQKSEIRQMNIGDILPDIELKEIVNYSSQSAKISDFKSKLLIFDFWATWCSPCIGAFAKLDSLQKEFAGKVQILPVTTEDTRLVSDFLQKFNNIKHISVSSVTNDKILYRIFKHTVIPHYVWVNEEHKVIAITEAREITEANIKKALNSKESPNLPLKDDGSFRVQSDSKGLTFSPSIKVDDGKNVSIVPFPDSNIVLHTILTRYVEGLSAGFQIGHSSLFFNARNQSIARLYQIALLGNSVRAFQPSSSLNIEIQDSVLYQRISPLRPDGTEIVSPGLQYLAWLKENGYCYEMSLPASLYQQKFDIMLEDLNRYFGALYGIQGVLEKRKGKYLALIRTTEEDRLATHGGKKETQVDKLSIKIKNDRMSALIAGLYTPMQSYPPIMDETKYKGNIDIELDCSLSDITQVNEGLKKYGLKLEEKETLLDVGVIKMK